MKLEKTKLLFINNVIACITIKSLITKYYHLMILTNFLLKDLFRECSLKFTFYVIESLQSQGHKR